MITGSTGVSTDSQMLDVPVTGPLQEPRAPTFPETEVLTPLLPKARLQLAAFLKNELGSLFLAVFALSECKKHTKSFFSRLEPRVLVDSCSLRKRRTAREHCGAPFSAQSSDLDESPFSPNYKPFAVSTRAMRVNIQTMAPMRCLANELECGFFFFFFFFFAFSEILTSSSRLPPPPPLPRSGKKAPRSGPRRVVKSSTSLFSLLFPLALVLLFCFFRYSQFKIKTW